MTIRVYLADLRHNYSGMLANDCMPLGVGYMKAVIDRDLPEVEARLFAYPDKLLAAMEAQPPDADAQQLHVERVVELPLRHGREAPAPADLGRDARAQYLPRAGPALAYLAAHPEIDVYALGEGDLLARAIVREFLAADGSLARFGEREIPSSVFRRPSGELVLSTARERMNSIDGVPSPWLTGVLDEFF